MKRSTAKKAFLLNLVSVLLCLSMLVGTTFAWFTDTVSSGVNRIVAGNLDIEVSYLTKDANGNFSDPTQAASWGDLEGTSSLFSTSMWEPGHTEIVYLKVENKGTLALNYKMNVSPVSEIGGINVAGESFKLSDYLVFKTSNPSETLNLLTRAGARSLAGTTRKLNQNDLTQTGSMLAGDPAQYIVLVVYMPEEVGNEANYKTGTTPPQIELGITFVATQKVAESDSYGDDYDENAISEAPGYVVGPAYAYFPQVLQTAAINKSGTDVTNPAGDSNVYIDTSNGTVIITSSATVEGTTEAAVIVEIPQEALPDGDSNPGIEVVKTATTQAAAEAAANENKDIATFEISTVDLPKGPDGKLAAPVTVRLFVGKGLDGVEVFHNGSKMTSGVSYDPITGYVTIESDSFSPFDILYDKVAARIGTTLYKTIHAAIDAVPVGTATTITLVADSTFDVTTAPLTIAAGKNLILELNGYSISGYYQGAQTSAMITNYGTLTIKDATDTAKNGSGAGSLQFVADPVWLYQGGTDYSGSYASNLISNRNSGVLNVYSGYLFNGAKGSACYAIDNYNAGKVTIYGGKLNTNKASAIRMFYNSDGALTIYDGILGGPKSYMGVQVMGGPKSIVNLHGGIYNGQYSAFVGTGTNFSQSEFNITGGIFNSEVSFAAEMTNVSISGGTFNGWCGSYGTLRFITGGTFAQDPSDYVANGYMAIPNDAATPTSWTVSESIAAIMDGIEYATIGDAIAAFNAAAEEKAYTLTIYNGIHCESDMVIIQDPAKLGKTLRIQAQNAGAVTIKPNIDSETGHVFLISGLSSYTGGAVAIDGIKFDLSAGPGYAIYLGGGGSGSSDAYITPIYGGDAHRYAHDITITNCVFIGDGTENTKAVEAAQGAAAAGIVIEDCVADNLGYLAQGYFQDASGKTALTITGCAVTNTKALVNNQGGASTTIVEGCEVSTYYDYVIRTNGTYLVVTNTDFTSTYEGEEIGGILVCRANGDVTVDGCTFTKAVANMYDVYNEKGTTVTVNGEITLAKGETYNIT